MAVRLSRLVREPRRIDLGYGVFVTVRPATFAELQAAERAALRLARERLPEAARMAEEVVFEAGTPEGAALAQRATEYLDRIEGLAQAILTEEIVERFATGWEGVLDAEGEPVPLSREGWAAFRDAYPQIAAQFWPGVRAPADFVAREKKS